MSRREIVIIFVGIVIIICIVLHKRDNTFIDNTKVIDSLETEISKLATKRDSIDERIDTITITIEKTHIQYEKDRNTIINNSTSEDYVFFLDYIQANKSRLDSINNL